MENENKRLAALVLVLTMFVLMLYSAVYHPLVSAKLADEKEVKADSYENAEADITFWYSDESYTAFYQACAKDYYDETGVAVALNCTESLGFLESVYQTSIDDTKYPDLYMIQSDSLGKAYLYGVAAENTDAKEYGAGFAEKAMTASSCDGTVLGYPISFEDSVLVYQTAAFAEAPSTIQQILDYGDQNVLGLGSGNLLEWDATDEFYTFAFVGSSFQFDQVGGETLSVTKDDDLYQQNLAFYQTLADTIAIDTETISRQQVLDDFNAGATVTAIVDSDDLNEITDIEYGVGVLPALNDTLQMEGTSNTKMLVVNDFGEKKDMAADFAKYVTLEKADELEAMTGHISVKTDAVMNPNSKVAYEQYEKSVVIPNTMDQEDFWTEMRNLMMNVWNGEVFS